MSAGVADFTDPEASDGSPLATRLFAVEGVTGVFLGADFVTVTKAEGLDWYVLKPAVLGAMMEHYLSGDPVIVVDETAPAEGVAAEEDSELVKQIRELIDTRVRPAVAQDGGDIVFKGFERGVVYLHMRGACAGCPSSTITLKNGIENLLRYYVPEVAEVRQID
jgi:Fe-S cluster biogenesis protein NfuA